MSKTSVKSGGGLKSNRTLIGLLCIVVALVIVFALAPLLQKSTGSTREIIRLANDVARGDVIEEADIEIVSVGAAGLPTDNTKILLDPSQKDRLLRGGEKGGPMYARVDLYKGDYFNTDRLAESNFASITAEDSFSNDLNGSKVAISVQAGNFSQMLSGKLQNGDIVSLMARDEDTRVGFFIPELRYVQILTTTTEAGFDRNEVRPNEDGSIPNPVSFTVIVRPEQAQLLVAPEDNEAFHVVLVCRGDDPRAKTYLEAQELYLDATYGPIGDNIAITGEGSDFTNLDLSGSDDNDDEEEGVQVN